MKVCLRNTKYIFYNYNEEKFGYYVGNCYIENGMITGFGNEDTGFDQIYDMTGKLIMPMLCNLDCNLEDNVFYRLQSNWDTTKFTSLENTMGYILAQNNSEYYEDIAPSTLRNIINTGTGLISTRRCYKTLQTAPIFSLTSYPISRAQHLRGYISPNYISQILNNIKSSNIIHGFTIRNLSENDDGSLSLVRDNINKVKFISCTTGQSELSQNLVKQKWLKDELQILNTYNLLHSNTLLFGCNTFTENELKRIKDCEATIVYEPLMAKTLNIVPGNMQEAENQMINWYIASGSPSCVDDTNMFYVLQETSKMFPEIRKDLLLKAVTINPLNALQKICSVSFASQANFTMIDAPYDFDGIDAALEYIFSKNYKELNSMLMLCGQFVTYQAEDNVEKNKNILRSYYKHFDEYLGNPNLFLREVPQKP